MTSSVRPRTSSHAPPQDDRGDEPTPTRPDDVGWRRGRPAVRRAREAVDATEERVCGSAAVVSPAVAEGLALSGRRAANRLGDAADPPAAPLAPRAPRVHHRVRGEADEHLAGAPFELVAGDVQEAVDHCLVAHRLVSRTGRPVVCTLEPATARRLGVFRMPPDAAVGELPPPRPQGETAEGGDHAGRAFAAVAASLGRACGGIVEHRTEGAAVLVVAMGDARTHASTLAEAARRAGIACGTVGIAQARPFPSAALRERLHGAEHVVVLGDGADQPGSLAATLRAALANGKAGPEVVTLPAEASATALFAALDQPDLEVASEGAEERAEPVHIGAIPRGRWGRGLLRALAAEIASLAPVDVAEPEGLPDGPSVLALGSESIAPADVELDVLVAAHPRALDPDRLAGRLAPGATVLVVGGDATVDTLWASLDEIQRAMIEERRIELWVADGAAFDRLSQGDPERVRALAMGAMAHAAPILGAMAHAAPILGGVAGRTTKGALLEALVTTLASEDDGDRLAPLLRQGAEHVGRVEAAHRQGRAHAEAGPDRPEMPPAAEPDPRWTERLRQFHLLGRGAHAAGDPFGTLPLWPAILHGALGPERIWHDYPLYVPAAGQDLHGAPVPLGDRLHQALGAMSEAGERHELIEGHVPRAVRAFARCVEERKRSTVPFASIRDEALVRFADEFEVSEAAREELRGQVRAWRRHLPDHGTLVGLDDSTLLRLHVAALQRARRARVTAIRDEIESLAAKLSDVLRADGLHAPSGTRPQSFGQVSGALFDEGRLGEELGARRGSRRLSAERRQRIEGALRVMKAHLARSDGPGVIVLHPGTVAPLVELPGAEVLEHAAALEVAQGLFDGLVAQWVELFRAVRLARLEVTGSYEPDRHEEGLAAFGAEALSPDELAAVPAVVVLETTRRIRGPLLSSLSDLMRSGRPIHVLVSDSPWDVEDGSARGWTMAVGYLAVAHREAFVVQSTLGRPRHLRDGIEAMARALRPGVAVVGAPGRGDLVPSAVQLAVAHEARATPCFVYDPDAGPSWADRLDLGGNSQPEEAWPAYDVPYRDADGNEADLTCRFTFADVAALDPELRDSFRVVPPEAWNDDQLEVADYLAAWERGEAADKLPFLWVVREDGALARAIVTRELAFAAHDRTGAWRTLQELGGIHNEWARRAAEAARATARAEAEREREALSERHEAERAEIRSSAAADALQRVAEVLLNLESAPASSNVGAAPTAAPMPAPDAPASPPVAKDASAAAETPAAEPEPAPEEEDEAPSFDEPYIDTPLCTTCNECTNLNPRLFKYDDNKQAYIADPGAGTYAELVQAAEKCPALCIHPGAPREGDSTATPDVVARAEPFR